MKKIKEYTKKQLIDFIKMVSLKGYSGLNKLQLYEKILKYFKENYEYMSEYLMHFNLSHVISYCKKDVSNNIVEIYKENNFKVIDSSLINTFYRRQYNDDLVRELSFLIHDCVYKICSDENNSFLVLENDEYYGFIAPEIEIDDEDDEDDEFIKKLEDKIEKLQNGTIKNHYNDCLETVKEIESDIENVKRKVITYNELQINDCIQFTESKSGYIIFSDKKWREKTNYARSLEINKYIPIGDIDWINNYNGFRVISLNPTKIQKDSKVFTLHKPNKNYVYSMLLLIDK